MTQERLRREWLRGYAAALSAAASLDYAQGIARIVLRHDGLTIDDLRDAGAALYDLDKLDIAMNGEKKENRDR